MKKKLNLSVIAIVVVIIVLFSCVFLFLNRTGLFMGMVGTPLDLSTPEKTAQLVYGCFTKYKSSIIYQTDLSNYLNGITDIEEYKKNGIVIRRFTEKQYANISLDTPDSYKHLYQFPKGKTVLDMEQLVPIYQNQALYHFTLCEESEIFNYYLELIQTISGDWYVLSFNNIAPRTKYGDIPLPQSGTERAKTFLDTVSDEELCELFAVASTTQLHPLNSWKKGFHSDTELTTGDLAYAYTSNCVTEKKSVYKVPFEEFKEKLKTVCHITNTDSVHATIPYDYEKLYVYLEGGEACIELKGEAQPRLDVEAMQIVGKKLGNGQAIIQMYYFDHPVSNPDKKLLSHQTICMEVLQDGYRIVSYKVEPKDMPEAVNCIEPYINNPIQNSIFVSGEKKEFYQEFLKTLNPQEELTADEFNALFLPEDKVDFAELTFTYNGMLRLYFFFNEKDAGIIMVTFEVATVPASTTENSGVITSFGDLSVTQFTTNVETKCLYGGNIRQAYEQLVANLASIE